MTRLQNAYDNTRISNFKRCPRFSYFRDERHFQTEAKSSPLVFGSAWGKALDAVWEWASKGPTTGLLDIGIEAFNAAWLEAGMPPSSEIDKELEKELSPRTPRVAASMLAEYIEERDALLAEAKLVGSEVSFMVPLGDSEATFYTGLFDKLLMHRGQMICLEHKTTTQYRVGGPFRTAWLDSFSPNSQVDGYLYALLQLFPKKPAAVWVDGALVHKTTTGFQIIPIEKQSEHVEAFVAEALYWVSQIEAEKAKLARCSGTDRIMRAFPKNTNSCHAYNVACPYLDLCRAWPNPVGRETPPGYVVEPWDPLARNAGTEPLRPGAAISGV